MRLYFFRTSSEISVKAMEEVAEKVGRVFGVDYSVFTGPICGGVDSVTMRHLLGVSDRFLDRDEPVVAIVFTKESVDDCGVLGETSELNRGAWVSWSHNIQRVIITVLHELGHLCDADHCVDESCVMFYAYREHSEFSFSNLFCERCRLIIQNSWVYNRLIQASEVRAREGRRLPKIVESVPLHLKRTSENIVKNSVVNGQSSCLGFPPFPDWSLASRNTEEFVRRVREHFGCKKKGN